MAMALDTQDAPAPQHARQEASQIAAPEAPRDRLIKVGTKTMPVSEFNARVKAASAATSAFFVSLAELPYQQRLDVIDALHPTAMRKERETLMREGPDSAKKPTEGVTIEMRGAKQPVAERKTSDTERTAIKATETPAPAATPSPSPSARARPPRAVRRPHRNSWKAGRCQTPKRNENANVRSGNARRSWPVKGGMGIAVGNHDPLSLLRNVAAIVYTRAVPA